MTPEKQNVFQVPHKMGALKHRKAILLYELTPQKCLHVFSHPDCHCRSRNRTGSAAFPQEALADCTAGGDFHPALKTFYTNMQ